MELPLYVPREVWSVVWFLCAAGQMNMKIQTIKKGIQ